MVGVLTDEEIETVLLTNTIGRLGCNDTKKTYIVPVSYVYDGKNIIAHSAEGLKINMMRKFPDVCFEVDAIQDQNNWQSVISWGTFQELTAERDRYQAMKLFAEKMMHLKISETAAPPELKETREHPEQSRKTKAVIYRIILTEKTGRFEK
jgi:nitroimidazol reductase NimA-like FMN-containing flavoprotein (pyridoxamine 5'-phosphate oxidase superfamily)